MKYLNFLAFAFILGALACSKSDDDEVAPSVQNPPNQTDKNPVACFTVNQERSGEVDFVFKFSDCSDNVQTYSWDFGDGNSSSAVSPSHVYDNYGKYEVTLTVQGNDTTAVYTSEIEYGEYKVKAFNYDDVQPFDTVLADTNCSMTGKLVAIYDNGTYICASNYFEGPNCTSVSGNYKLTANPILYVSQNITCFDGTLAGIPVSSTNIGYNGNPNFNLDEELVYNNIDYQASNGAQVKVNVEFELVY